MPVSNDQEFERDIRRLEKLAGLNDSRPGSARLKGLLAEILADIDCIDLIAPSISREIVPVRTIKSGIIKLSGGAMLKAPLLAQRMARASHIMFGVTTIGSGMARAVRQCFRDGKSVKAVLLEELANGVLFEAADGLQPWAEERALAMGLCTSGPLSPGDREGFGLDQQGTVLALAGAENIGITMTRTGQMNPVHSMSVVIGLGERMRKWARIDDCEACRSHEKCRHYRAWLEAAA